MLKVTNCCEQADECRRLAGHSTLPDIREQLLKMAEAWDHLADQQAHELTQQAMDRETLPVRPPLNKRAFRKGP